SCFLLNSGLFVRCYSMMVISLPAALCLAISGLEMFCDVEVSNVDPIIVFFLSAPEIPDISNKQLQWESNMGNAFCKGGFNYTDGHLVVPRAGYYRVFLQITYGDQGGDADTHCKNRETLKLSHSVSYFHDSYPDYQPLLSAVDTVICAQGWRKSLFTSGLFHLDKDSVLKVESEQPKRIVRNEHEVFFGAELLPDSR
uniref:THD domain-containing protein n=1 Tax=Nothobranchius furzeri TaxID=105023 RepID=A0A8C6LVH6_NOTFU